MAQFSFNQRAKGSVDTTDKLPDTPANFQSLGISSRLQDSVAASGWSSPTEIQKLAIPVILSGRDVVALSSTGSGKTGAFGLPMVHQIAEAPEQGGVRGLIIAPARELADQIAREMAKFAANSGIEIRCCTGGTYSNTSFPRDRSSIIVGTPGRLHALIVSRRVVDVSRVVSVVIDEFDAALKIGMFQDIRAIHSQTPVARQTLLFSATMAGDTERSANSLLRDPARVTAGSGRVPEQIRHISYPVKDAAHKRALLVWLLRNGDISEGAIYTRTKLGAKELCDLLRAEGFSATYISSDIKDQRVRSANLNRFFSGDAKFLVATDVAGRGIDFPGSPTIINFDYPVIREDYFHRAGRTGRNGREGTVVTFVTDRDAVHLTNVSRDKGFTVDRRAPPNLSGIAVNRLARDKIGITGSTYPPRTEGSFQGGAESAVQRNGISNSQIASNIPLSSFRFNQRILDILPESNVQSATKFERELIPWIQRGDSVVGVAPENVGRVRTLILPIFDSLLHQCSVGDTRSRTTSVLILTPDDSRGFSLWHAIKPFTHGLSFWSTGVFDCTNQGQIDRGFQNTPVILTTTPTGLLYAVNDGYTSLDGVKTVLIEGADRVLSNMRICRLLQALIPPERSAQSVLLAEQYTSEFAGHVANLFPGGMLFESSGEAVKLRVRSTAVRPVPENTDGEVFSDAVLPTAAVNPTVANPSEQPLAADLNDPVPTERRENAGDPPANSHPANVVNQLSTGEAAKSDLTKPEKRPAQYAGHDYKSDLELEVTINNRGRLRFSIVPKEHGDLRVFEVVVKLNKVEIAKASHPDQETAVQEASRVALGR